MCIDIRDVLWLFLGNTTMTFLQRGVWMPLIVLILWIECVYSHDRLYFVRHSDKYNLLYFFTI